MWLIFHLMDYYLGIHFFFSKNTDFEENACKGSDVLLTDGIFTLVFL